MRVTVPIIIWLLSAGMFLTLHAQSWSFSIDNDMIFGSDDKYTGGFQVGWMSDALGESEKGSFQYGYVKGMSDLLRAVYPFELSGMKQSGAISLQGIAITPEDTNETEPVYDDVPYMGSTALTASLFIWNENIFHEALITLGIMGPSSGAESVQKGLHRFFRIDEPKGWDNQVPDRLLFQTGYVMGTRQYAGRVAERYTFEWFNSLSVNAGSSYVGAGGGTAVRIGENVPKNFVTISGIVNRSLANQLNLEARKGRLGWSVNLGLFADVIGYFYLHEYAKQHGYDFEMPTTIITGLLGFDLYYETLRASLELYPSRPIGQYVRSNYFGRLNLVLEIP